MDYAVPQTQPENPDAAAIGQYPYVDDTVIEPVPVDPQSIVDQLNARFGMTNIAETLTPDKLATIGRRVVDDFESDKDSRMDWDKEQEEIAKLSTMTTEQKTWAGRPVSNVKFPMIMQAAIHYASRAYPEIVKGKDVVKCVVVGKDESGMKAAKANRVGAHMSFQLLEGMDWEQELDQLLMMYAITGSQFKKTYYCQLRERNVSELVLAKDLVVDYWAKSLEDAARITHTIELQPNDIIERLNAGVFRQDLTIDDFGKPESDNSDYGKSQSNDEDAPHIFLEQHRWLDLDNDGYQEPYIVTVHQQSATVVRICARYDIDGLKLTPDGRIQRIEPVHYFTHFKFLPNPDGSFYGIGFGKLLFGINASINAIVNQLIDAGTANNRMSGFIGRGVQIGRSSSGNDGFLLGAGEWKAIPSTGDDVRKNIVPMPSKEPSPVLFQMLQFLIETGKELSSVSDIMEGESPGANVPAASTLALIEQGMKVFSGTFKRLYRSLKEELKKIARLNRMYLSEVEYINVLDDQMAVFRDDYNDSTLDIIPVADTSNLSDIGRALKMRALMELQGQGFDDFQIKKRYLESLNIENSEELLPPESAQPTIPPEIQAQIDKTNAEAEKIRVETVTAAVTSQYSAMQAANVIVSAPGTAPIADALLLSAGFVDKNQPPIVPLVQQGIQPGMQPTAQQNTSPLFPALPTTGMNQGIETPENDMGIPKRELGGPVYQSQPYVVGEKGPEIFVPQQQGTIIPNNNIVDQNVIETFKYNMTKPQPDASFNPGVNYGYGKRVDGTNKGIGFFGPLKGNEGEPFTELSAGSNIHGHDVLHPLIVPTLTRDELEILKKYPKYNEIPQQILQKARDHATLRIAQGKSPFHGPDDPISNNYGMETLPIPKQLDYDDPNPLTLHDRKRMGMAQ